MNDYDIRDAVPRVFISYSHKDEEWKERLATHLRIFGRQLLLDIWDDSQIKGGENWHDKINEAMETASLAIIMISADSLSSDFIRDKELPRLAERNLQDNDPFRLVPVIVRPSAWEAVPELRNLQLLPRHARPLIQIPDQEIDEVLVDIVREVVRLLATRNPIPAHDAQRTVEHPLQEVSDEEARVLEKILNYTKRHCRPPKCSRIFALLKGNRKSLKATIDRLQQRNWIVETRKQLMFTDECCHSWPPLALSDLNRALAVILGAQHVSTHFRVNNRRSIAPWTTCYTCHVPFDIVTDLEQPGGLTAYMVSNRGIFNVDREKVRKFRSSYGSSKPTPDKSPIYGSEFRGLLAFELTIDNQEAGFIKVENKLGGPQGDRFTKSDEDILRSFAGQTIHIYRRAWQWIRQRYPDPKVITLFDNPRYAMRVSSSLPTVTGPARA